MSSSESRRREVTEQTCYAVEDCSRSVQRRLEKLGRRKLRVGYGEQTVRETKRNADAFETPTLLDDEVRQRGITVPGHEDICKSERPAWNPSAYCLLPECPTPCKKGGGIVQEGEMSGGMCPEEMSRQEPCEHSGPVRSCRRLAFAVPAAFMETASIISSLPLSASTTLSLFHCELKTYLLNKSFPPPGVPS